jgi:hypothetical protein
METEAMKRILSLDIAVPSAIMVTIQLCPISMEHSILQAALFLTVQIHPAAMTLEQRHAAASHVT